MDQKQKMKYFVTGATGFIGSALARKLADSGHTVHALFRSKSKTASIKHSKIRLFKGNLLDPKSIHQAMKGCHFVFHTAALTKIWSKNPSLYHEVNITGTKNVLEAALNLEIKKVVITSTAGVFGPSSESCIHEQTARKTPFFTEYEKTKAKADELALLYSKKGIDIVIVCPTRVYGPGPIEESNSATKIIRSYIRGKWHIIPGNGKSIGNYVYIDDVVKGHILALKKGRTGEKYILGGENASYIQFFNLLKNASQKKYFLFKIPVFAMKSFSQIFNWLASMFKFYPVITPEMVKKLTRDWSVSSEKAVRELGYSPISLQEGIKKTLEWLNTL